MTDEQTRVTAKKNTQQPMSSRSGINSRVLSATERVDKLSVSHAWASMAPRKVPKAEVSRAVDDHGCRGSSEYPSSDWCEPGKFIFDSIVSDGT
jgi:hypothetical protein